MLCTHVDDTDNKVEVLGHQVLVVLGDEDPSDVELDVVPLLLLLKEVERSSLGDVEHRLELELTLNRKVLDGKVVLPVVRDRLVEGRVLVGSDVRGVPALVSFWRHVSVEQASLPGPDGLLLVEFLVLGGSLLDLLGLLGLLRVLVLDLLNLVVTLLDLLVVLDLLLGLLGDNELDGVRDELGLGSGQLWPFLFPRVISNLRAS